jgi:hypothetical protein
MSDDLLTTLNSAVADALHLDLLTEGGPSRAWTNLIIVTQEEHVEWFVASGGDLRVRSWQLAAPEPDDLRTRHEPAAGTDHLEWLSEHLDDLEREYAGSWVAILDGAVVASAPTLPELLDASRDFDRPFITEVVPPPATLKMTFGQQVV